MSEDIASRIGNEIRNKLSLDNESSNKDFWSTKFYLVFLKILSEQTMVDSNKSVFMELGMELNSIQHQRIILGKDDDWEITQLLVFLSKDFDNHLNKSMSYFYEETVGDILKKGTFRSIISNYQQKSDYDEDMDNVAERCSDLMEIFEQKPSKKYTIFKMLIAMSHIYSVLAKKISESLSGIPKTKDLSRKSLLKKMVAVSILIYEDYLKRALFQKISAQHQLMQNNVQIDTVPILKLQYTDTDRQELRVVVWIMRIIFEQLGLKETENLIGKAKLIDYLMKGNTSKVESICETGIYIFLTEDFGRSGSAGLTVMDSVIEQFKGLDNIPLLEAAEKIEQKIKSNTSSDTINTSSNTPECGNECCFTPSSDESGTNEYKTVRRKVTILKYLFEKLKMSSESGKSTKMRFINFVSKEYIGKNINDTPIKTHYYLEEIGNDDSGVIIILLEGVGIKDIKKTIRAKIKTNSKY